MDPLLEQFGHIVEALKFKAEDHALGDLIKKSLGASYTGPIAFQIKNEILRQNKDSRRSIQINEWIPKAEPDPYFFDEVPHYLDPLSAAYFRTVYEGYGGRYTVGVEERVVDFIKKNKDNILNLQQNRNVQVTGIALHEHIYRKEERMHLGIRLWVDRVRGEFSDDTLYHRNKMIDAEEAVSQNISMSGLKLKHSRPGKEGQLYAIRFSGWERDFVLPTNAVVYKLMKSTRIPDKEDSVSEFTHEWFLQIVPNKNHDAFLSFLASQINANRFHYRVNIDNVERSVVNQITEQFITNRQESFSLFLDAHDRCRYVYGSLLGQEHYDKFKHPSGHLLETLLQREGLFSSDIGEINYICGFKQKSGVVFATILSGSSMSNLFCRYALSRPDAFVYKAEKAACDLTNAFMSHNLPDDAAGRSHSIKVRRNVNEYGDDTRAEVNHLRTMLTLTPMPVGLLASTLPLLSVVSDEQLGEFKRFAVLQAKRNAAPFVRAKSRELRREDRFKLETPFEIDTHNMKGRVVDVSESGIAVRVAEGKMPSEGRIVTLRFPNLPVIRHYAPEVSYQVVSADGDLLRLCAEISGELAERRYWTAYFENNIDTLEPVEDHSINQGALFGLDRALRNVRNSSLTNVSALLKVKQARAVASHVNVPANVSKWPLFKKVKANYQPSLSLKALFCNLPFQDYLSKSLRVINKDNPFEYAVVAVFHNGFEEDVPVIQGLKVFSEAFTSPEQIDQFTAIVKRRGSEVSWFVVSTTRKSRIFDLYYREELSYIKKMAVHRAEHLKEVVDHTLGVVEITPLDSWLACRQHCFDVEGLASKQA